MMLRAALGFFTRLPIGSAPLPPTFQGVAVWLPVVGLIIGALVSLALGLAAQLLPASLCGVIGCLVWVAVTGGLHLDGVADCGDGLIVEAPPARRLEIMKDSRLGTFGGAALFFILALKAAALGALAGTFQADGSGPDAFASLLLSCCLAGTLARCMVSRQCAFPRRVRAGSRSPARSGTSRHELIALAIGLGICAVNGVRGLYALAIALLAAYLLLSAAKKRLGGVTGDVFGCLVELTECVVLIVCCV
ncbi:MAG: adenosylcobinamide-GDP ribazoletransferase [Bilophila wadsworthia]